MAGDAIVTRNPATGEVLERLAYLDDRALEAELASAEAAAAQWATSDIEQRTGLLRRIAIRLREQHDELATTSTTEMGKPIAQARAEIEKCAWCCDFFAEHGPAMLAPQAIASNAARSY
ncbi:MAG: aldehyde dehydrogenase family protein, partial [Candidatus Eremiobacteraeota bacterium]|nr:aldehyde dehydrogenase family protein [Candidatus Eremiobacteraeota bacterium]